MRLLSLALVILPLPIWAETYTALSRPDAVTVYSGLAVVTRTVTLDAVQGRHEVILPDLPKGIDPASLRVAVQGARLDGTRLRTDVLPPAPDRDTPAITAARARIDAAERALEDLDNQIEDAKLVARAAQARMTFLSGLQSSQTLPSESAALADLAQMVEMQSLAALRTQIDAEREADRIAEGRESLGKELRDARAALRALMPPGEPGALLALRVTVDAPGALVAKVSYPVAASWQPTYDILLDRSGAALRLRRGALVTQDTGEAWDDITLTLSTLAPTGQIVPSTLYPPLLRYVDPDQPVPLQRTLSAARPEAEASGAFIQADESYAKASFDGPGVTYQPADPVSVASGADGVRLALDTLDFDARVFARAVPALDTTAYLMTEARNTTDEPLLAAGDAQVFVDGDLVGRTLFEFVPAGGDFTQAFGPIEDLRLTRTVLDRSEGDRGLISRSNARTEAVRLEVENLGDESWDVELREAVPYTEQDDLKIEWSADPAPDLVDAEDRRGLLQWMLSIQGGGVQTVIVEQNIRWPDGKILN